MKNLISKFAVIAFISFLVFASFDSKAQVALPYRLDNTTQCPISVSYTVYNGTPCNTAICISGGPTVILPGGALTIPATFCSTACRLDIQIGMSTFSYPMQFGPNPVPNLFCNGPQVVLYLNSSNSGHLAH